MDSQDSNLDPRLKLRGDGAARLPPIAAASLIVYIHDFRLDVVRAVGALAQCRQHDRTDVAAFAAERIERYRELLRIAARRAPYHALHRLCGDLAISAHKHVDIRTDTACRRHFRAFAESLKDVHRQLYQRASTLRSRQSSDPDFVLLLPRVSLPLDVRIPDVASCDGVLAWFDDFGNALDVALTAAIDESYARLTADGQCYAASAIALLEA